MIKLKLEDFVVKEIITLKKSNGKYLYIEVEKRNLNTLDVVKIIADSLRMPRKHIGYAGYKDKNAVTTQYFSLLNVKKEDVKKIKFDNINIKALYYGDKPIYLGALKENKFKIVVRNLNSINKLKIDFIENYFDEQRFGNKRNNHLVGEALIKKDFKKAVELINDERLNEYLKEKVNDFIGALKLLNFKIISLYISAFQSFLFNSVLAEYLKSYKYFKVHYCAGELLFLNKKIKNFKIPIINFDFEFSNDKVSLIYKKLLGGIELRNFIIKEFPYSVSYTAFRDAFVNIKNFKYKYSKDELNMGRNKVILEFSLPAGSYATIVVKKLFSENYIK